ncbi:MAG: bleomycin resistance protein [Chthoniobacterales bacterium]
MDLKAAIPVIRVSSSIAAQSFYCDKLGFTQTFAYRPDTNIEDPCYMGAFREGVLIHISSFEANGPTGMSAAFIVDDVDALHAEFLERAVEIHMPPTNQTWGNREMYLRDPDGNKLAFIQELAGK